MLTADELPRNKELKDEVYNMSDTDSDDDDVDLRKFTSKKCLRIKEVENKSPTAYDADSMLLSIKKFINDVNNKLLNMSSTDNVGKRKLHVDDGQRIQEIKDEKKSPIGHDGNNVYHPIPLGQEALMSILLEFAHSINNDTSEKVALMTEIALAIDPRDQVIAMRGQLIFSQVYRILRQQYALPTTSRSDAQNIHLLAHVINSLSRGSLK